jgi:hypothetical protein
MDDPASHPLDGPRGKLVRAVQVAASLEARCSTYAEENPYRLACRFEGDAHYAYVDGTPPPRYLGLILGELIHDLRSALDQVAWQLALSHVGPEVLEDRRIGALITYPVSYSSEQFRKNKALPYFASDAVELMDKRQPYRNAEEQTHLVNPLTIVQAWSNDDKHRVLTPTLGRLATDDVSFQSDATIDIESVEMLVPDGTLVDPAAPLFKIPAPESARIEFIPVPPHICFLTFATGVADVLHCDRLRLLCLHVSECVIDFEPLFPPVDWSSRTESWTTPDM